MTIKEMLFNKYAAQLKTMNKVTWDNLMSTSKETGVHPAECMYMGLEITADDIRDNGGWTGELWEEIDRAYKAKLLASNKHRQASGQVTKYWLTKKGFKALNKNGAIC